MARASTSWKPGQSGNPKGSHGGSVLALVRRLARESSADEEIAAAILQGMRTGWLPLRRVDRGTGKEIEGYQLETIEQWLSVVKLVWGQPAPPEPSESLDRVLERIRNASDAELEEVRRAYGGA